MPVGGLSLQAPGSDFKKLAVDANPGDDTTRRGAHPAGTQSRPAPPRLASDSDSEFDEADPDPARCRPPAGGAAAATGTAMPAASDMKRVPLSESKQLQLPSQLNLNSVSGRPVRTGMYKTRSFERACNHLLQWPLKGSSRLGIFGCTGSSAV